MKIKDFKDTQKGQQAVMIGMAMGNAIAKERKRNRWHFAAIWAAIIAVFLMAALG